MWQHIRNIYHLGVKEIIELMRDMCMIILIIYSFTLGVYIVGLGTPDPVIRAPIAIVDEDNTQLSKRISDAFLPPLFQMPKMISLDQVDPGLDSGKFTFAIVIPSNFERHCLAGKKPEIQVNADATLMTQAFVGAGYIRQIIDKEIKNYSNRQGTVSIEPAKIDLRDKFNPNLITYWFGGVNQIVNNITMLAIVLIGAALIRERERGTLEHLLVMPVIPFEIMCAKIWSMLLVILIASLVSVVVVMQGMLEMPIDGSLSLFMLGVALHLFAVTSMGICLACVAQNMPQMGILLILFLIPMNMLSGGMTPRESMPTWVQYVMEVAPTTHFVKFSQQILFRGAGWATVWRPFLSIVTIGLVLFCFALYRFRRSATQS